jgi:hypothetical protein
VRRSDTRMNPLIQGSRRASACSTLEPPVRNVLADFYRCPEELLPPYASEELHPESGYFHFGQAVGYGQVSRAAWAANAAGTAPDLSRQVAANGSGLRLPFDPAQAIDNLRMERYAGQGSNQKRRMLAAKAVRQAYYQLRPLLGVPVRKHLQRLFLRDWNTLPFPKWPVDTSVEDLHERLLILSMRAKGIETVPFIWFWPEGCRSCVMVTHDVETAAGAGGITRLMDTDASFGIRASYQLVPEERYSVSPALRQTIRKGGCEVNVQDLNHDGRLFSSRQTFLDRVPAINAYLREYQAQGFRAGSLFRNLEWSGALDAAYEMSVPNVAHLEAQRGGCCTVFPYAVGDLLELPVTTIQDYSLFQILGQYSIDLWREQITAIEKKNGLISVITHPDYLIEDKARRVYRELLSYLSALGAEREAWMALPGEVNRWWRERSAMHLTLEGGRWRITGPGRERARVAYARVVADEIVYTLDERRDR